MDVNQSAMYISSRSATAAAAAALFLFLFFLVGQFSFLVSFFISLFIYFFPFRSGDVQFRRQEGRRESMRVTSGLLQLYSL
jgi:ABC-type Fe3+-siderophore transport system permease subunit